MDALLAMIATVAPDLAPLSAGARCQRSLTLTRTFAEPGWLDIHEVAIDWGDGTRETLDLAAGAAVLAAVHAHDAAGVFGTTVVEGRGGRRSLLPPQPLEVLRPVSLAHCSGLFR